jgi:serine/threonine protein kinase
MGEVYRARDTRLDRTVAIKILPETLAADPQFRDRFDREAPAISQLDHPNICTLHDLGEQNGTAYLVMQYLEGETLEARLKKGALPLDQALAIAIQVASALDRAHRAGIIHRDLKPGNIMLTKSGAMLLDFGLAKATAVGAAAGLSMLPTTPPGLTAQGTILGTFQYMAPEQLEGREVDARTDIFAFGTVLHEMVTGRKAFEGKSRMGMVGAILRDTPPTVSSLVPVSPPELDRVIGTCLAKDPDDRWQNVRDIWRDLKWILETRATHMSGVGVGRHDVTSGRSSISMTAAAAIALSAAIVAGIAAWVLKPAPIPRSAVARVAVALPPGDEIGDRASPSVALSPDGALLAYVGRSGDATRLFVRANRQPRHGQHSGNRRRVRTVLLPRRTLDRALRAR